MPSAKTKKPKILSESLSALLNQIGIESKLKEYEVIVRWEQLVGERIAKATSPCRVVDGVLLIKVKNSAWQNELIYVKKEILGKIDRSVGAGIVKDIRYI